jgi:hypothetical protein
MATYDRYHKRLARLLSKVKESRGLMDLSYDKDKLKNPTKKENIEYIYAMLSENKIKVQLEKQTEVFSDLVDLNIEVE